MTPIENLQQALSQHASVMAQLEPMLPKIAEVAQVWRDCLANGGKILFMGNGGSAADSQHVAAEIVGRYKKERKGLPAIALTTDTSILTSVGNDYGFDFIFSRQVEALCLPQDVVVGFSTSGNSANVVRAIETAKAIGAKAKVPAFDAAHEKPMNAAAKAAVVTTVGHQRGEGVAVLSAEA